MRTGQELGLNRPSPHLLDPDVEALVRAAPHEPLRFFGVLERAVHILEAVQQPCMLGVKPGLRRIGPQESFSVADTKFLRRRGKVVQL